MGLIDWWNHITRKQLVFSTSDYQVLGNRIMFNDGFVSAENALKYSDIYAVVNKLATDMAGVALECDNRFNQRVLDNPSSTTNRYTFWSSICAQLLLTGNAYAYIWGDQAGRPSRLTFVPPSDVTLYINSNGQQLTYDIRFTDTELPDLKNEPSDHLLHFRLWDIRGGLIGRSPLRSLVPELNLQKANQKLTATALTDGASYTGMVKLQGNLEGREYREAIREEFVKAAKKNSILVTDPNMTYEPLQVSNDISRLLNATDWTSAQIAKVYSVPKDYLGEESDHSNIAMVTAHYEQTVDRYMQSIVSELESKLGGHIYYDVDRTIDLSGSQVEDRVAKLVKNGVITAGIAQQMLLRSHSDLLQLSDIATAQKLGQPIIPPVPLKGGDDHEDGKTEITD